MPDKIFSNGNTLSALVASYLDIGSVLYLLYRNNEWRVVPLNVKYLVGDFPPTIPDR
jgi:hypothetical protein